MMGSDMKVMDSQDARAAWDRARNRYLNDATFHAIVDGLVRAGSELDYGTRDIYDAATVAAAVLDGRAQ